MSTLSKTLKSIFMAAAIAAPMIGLVPHQAEAGFRSSGGSRSISTVRPAAPAFRAAPAAPRISAPSHPIPSVPAYRAPSTTPHVEFHGAASNGSHATEEPITPRSSRPSGGGYAHKEESMPSIINHVFPYWMHYGYPTSYNNTAAGSYNARQADCAANTDDAQAIDQNCKNAEKPESSHMALWLEGGALGLAAAGGLAYALRKGPQ